MLNKLFNKLFHRKKAAPVFIIDEYPLSASFFVRLKGKGYLRRDHYSGLIGTERDIYFATRCTHMKEAERLIDIYKEQNFLTTYKAHIR